MNSDQRLRLASDTIQSLRTMRANIVETGVEDTQTFLDILNTFGKAEAAVARWQADIRIASAADTPRDECG
ncbi:MAG: hypothetical protein AAFS13_06900 [Pseudomonadota bacterium]